MLWRCQWCAGSVRTSSEFVSRFCFKSLLMRRDVLFRSIIVLPGVIAFAAVDAIVKCHHGETRSAM
jgi:hypothetical protein